MRLAVLVQMIGVIVLALGIPAMFHGFEVGQWHNEAMVAGYVVMRVPMVALWLRAARSHPEGARTCRRYAVGVALLQVLWVLVGLFPFPLWTMAPVVIGLLLAEMALPAVAERAGKGTPWHPHHIAERYSLLAIIAFGEGIIGTVSTLEALIGESGWSFEVAALALAGITLTVGMWWIYFALPLGEVLARRRSAAFLFGYGHIPLFAAIAAMGAGLHVIAYAIEDASVLSPAASMVSVVVPVAVFCLGAFIMVPLLLPSLKFEAFYAVLLVVIALVLAASVGFAAWGLPLGEALLVAMLAPWVGVVGFEWVGHAKLERALAADAAAELAPS